MFGQQNARDPPVLRIDADGGGDGARLSRECAGALDFRAENRRQIGVERNVMLLLVSEARLTAASPAGIEGETGFDRGAAKTVGNGLVAPLHQEIAEPFAFAPEIERGIFA